MATRTEITVVRDLDGSTVDVSTVRFAVEGVDYEIDLSPANRAALHAALAPFTAAGRRLPAHRRARGGRTAKARTGANAAHPRQAGRAGRHVTSPHAT